MWKRLAEYMVILNTLETQFTTAVVSNVYLAISGPKLLFHTRRCAYFSIVNTPPRRAVGQGGRETFLIPFLGWLIGVLPDLDIGGVDRWMNPLHA